MTRVYNFSAGPATLPLEVLEQIKKELLDWQGTGVSIMEISHRSPEFEKLAAESEKNLRELLNVPDNYKILFLQGGGRSQFSMVPLNLLRGKTSADYIDTGVWSSLAIKEAERYAQVNVVASEKIEKYHTIPPQFTWQSNKDAAYFYYTDNETVNGVEFAHVPEIDAKIPLVSDMSSNFLSRQFDITKFGLIFAAAQKNIGPAGLTVVIVRKDLLGNALPMTPSMFNYQLHAQAHSLYNTAPTFVWYVTDLMFQWLKRQGGVAEIEKINARKAKKLYDFIDNSDFYSNSIDSAYRSRMNVVFQLADENLNSKFLQDSRAAGLFGLKGHKLVGGMRASIYNAMPESGVDSLIDFMKVFEKSAK